MVAVWLIAAALKLFKVKFNFQILGAIALIIAICLTAFGVYNVFSPQVKQVKVSIKDLPEEWQGKKIVQLTDLHLGRVLDEKFLEGVVQKTNALEPDIIVITGIYSMA